jgi:hypothetical protein
MTYGSLIVHSSIGAIALSILCFIALASFPSWREETDERTGSEIDIKPFPSGKILMLCVISSALTMMFMLASSLWQHVAAASAKSLIEAGSQGFAAAHVGGAAMALVWLGFMFSAVVTVYFVALAWYFNWLDRLYDD